MNNKSLNTIIQSFIWFQVLIFATYLVYHMPIYSDAKSWLDGLSMYHKKIHIIFLIYCLISLFLSMFFTFAKKHIFLKWFFLLLSFFFFSFSFFANRGYTWYFYENEDKTNKAILTIICLFVLSFLFHIKHLKKTGILYDILKNKIYFTALFIVLIILGVILFKF